MVLLEILEIPDVVPILLLAHRLLAEVSTAKDAIIMYLARHGEQHGLHVSHVAVGGKVSMYRTLITHTSEAWSRAVQSSIDLVKVVPHRSNLDGFEPLASADTDA